MYGRRESQINVKGRVRRVWTLWTTPNKMGIERVYLWWASDSIFKFLAFLLPSHKLCGQWDQWSAWPHDRHDDCCRTPICFAIRTRGFFCLFLGVFTLIPQRTLLLPSFTWTCSMNVVVALFIKWGKRPFREQYVFVKVFVMSNNTNTTTPGNSARWTMKSVSFHCPHHTSIYI